MAAPFLREAITLLVTEWVLIVLAFSGWGSSGLFSPMLLLGALFGYASATWSVDLGVAAGDRRRGVDAFGDLSRADRRRGARARGRPRRPMWWLSTLAVLSSTSSRHFGVKPFHEVLIERAGLRLLNGRAVTCSPTSRRARRCSTTSNDQRDGRLQEMRAAAAASRHNFLGVVSSSDGTYLGLLSLEQLPGRVRHVLRPDVRPSDIAASNASSRSATSSTISPRRSSPTKASSRRSSSRRRALRRGCRRKPQARGFLFESAVSGAYKREIASQVIRRY